jgi:acyl-coenzyme A thioesterase PaaI-like protein
MKNPFGLKMTFYDLGPGEVQSEYTVPEQYQSYPGIVHGGIISSMMDEVMGRVFMQDGSDRFMVTAKLSIRYRKPVPIGKKLKLFGHALSDNGKIGKATGEIYGPDDEKLVDGEIVVVNIPSSLLMPEDTEALGWQVYPD